MPAGPRTRANNAYGVTDDNPLTAGATVFNSTQLILLPAVIPVSHAVVVLDPKRVFGQPEIVVVTSHAGLATTATITRGTYGTIAREHPMGTAWAHVALDEDYTEILTSISRPTDPYVGQSIYEIDTQSHRHYTGAIWDSAPPVGTLLPFLGSTAPVGYLLADGAAVSRTGVTADLFSVISTIYGVGDGVTTFNLPNLNGRAPVGRDAAQAEFDVLGEVGGVKTVAITQAQLAQHVHGITDVQHNHGENSHNHSQNNHSHGTSEGAHDHALTGGNHAHALDGDYGSRFVATFAGVHNNQLARGDAIGGVQHTHGGGPGIDADFGGGEVSFTDIDHENILSPGDGGSALDSQPASTGLSVSGNIAGIIAATATNISSLSGISSTLNSGTNEAHNNLQPYLTVNFIVKI